MNMSIPLFHLELVRDRSVPFQSLKRTEQCAEILHNLLDKSPVEQMVVIYLDTSLNMVGVEKVGLGTTTMVSVTMSEIFRGAIVASVPFIVLGHNHPSDDSTPSAPDWDLTDKARDMGAQLGIDVLDHIVVTPTGKHVSMKAEDIKQQNNFISSIMGIVDSLPPEEKKILEKKINDLGLNPNVIPRKPTTNLDDLLPRSKKMPSITNLGDLLRKKMDLP